MPALQQTVKPDYGLAINRLPVPPYHFLGCEPGENTITYMTDMTGGKTLGHIKKQKESRNMRTGNSKNTRHIKSTEPETTLLDEGKFLRILTKLPGIAEEKIRIDLEKTLVTIVASDSRNTYKKVITLPCEVRFSKKRFSDGVLELVLEKYQSL